MLAWALALAAEAAFNPNDLDWNKTLGLIFGFLSLIVTTVLAVYMAKTKTVQTEQATVLKEVHVAVNSGRTALENKVERLEALVLGLTKANAALGADARSAELAKAGADATLLEKAKQEIPKETPP